MIIGLTGKNGSGKGVVADFLKTSGFTYYSLSDVIRAEIQKSGDMITREKLIAMGRKLREDGGPAALAELILVKLDIDKNYIVDSIRNPAEVKALKKCPGFSLLNIDAEQKIRFERIKKRARENDPTEFTEFVRLENEELTNQNPAAQQLIETAKLADYTLTNNDSVRELENQIKKTLQEIISQQKRPGWDEYFMNIAKVASLRSNCLKRKVAAVIVRDQRVVSTGYNGTPRGIKNCSEGGCPRCGSFGPSGADLGECLCSHAEENSIVQAAYHGASIKAATLYTTFSPCLICTKMILNSGIKEVVYNAAYPLGELPLKLLKEAGILVRQMET